MTDRSTWAPEDFVDESSGHATLPQGEDVRLVLFAYRCGRPSAGTVTTDLVVDYQTRCWCRRHPDPACVDCGGAGWVTDLQAGIDMSLEQVDAFAEAFARVVAHARSLSPGKVPT